MARSRPGGSRKPFPHGAVGRRRHLLFAPCTHFLGARDEQPALQHRYSHRGLRRWRSPRAARNAVNLLPVSRQLRGAATEVVRAGPEERVTAAHVTLRARVLSRYISHRVSAEGAVGSRYLLSGLAAGRLVGFTCREIPAVP